jgi:hypothetical protein
MMNFSNVLRLATGVLALAGGVCAAGTVRAEPVLAGAGGLLDSLYGIDNLTAMDPVNDRFWENLGDVEVIVKAKYGRGRQTLGYLSGQSGGDFVPLLTVGGRGLLDGVSAHFLEAEAGYWFRFGDRRGRRGPLWTSDPENNVDDLDHMLTWLITDDVGHADNQIGAYVIAFEIDRRAKKHDFNDLVVEVRGALDGPPGILRDPDLSVPAPAGLLLFGTGLSALGAVAWRRRRQL